MNKIVNKFLLAGYKFMPKMHLKQPGFTYNACEKSDIYYVQLIFLVNMHGLFLWKTKEELLDSSKSSEERSKGRKRNIVWVDKDSAFYNNLFKRFLKIDNIKMYSASNEGKSVVAERFIKAYKNRIFKHMAAVSKIFFTMMYCMITKIR